MGLQAINATPRNGNPAFPRDQNTGGMHTAHWATPQNVSFPGGVTSRKIESPHRAGRTPARAFAAVGACILWLAVGAVANEGRCDESSVRARADAVQGKVAQARHPPLAGGREAATESEQEKNKAEAAARALTSSPMRSAAETAGSEQSNALDQERERADFLARELDALRIDAYLGGVQAAEAEAKQQQALDKERDRADALARELDSVRAELDATRAAGSKAGQAADAESKQKQALDKERDRADALGRELGSVRAELDAARAAASKAGQVADAESKQKQALDKERERADALGRELGSVRAELDAARAAAAKAGQAADAESKQKQALDKERDRADALGRELASVRGELDVAQAAASKAEQAADAERKQKQALDQERGRADSLARELSSVHTELDAARAIGAQGVQAADADRKQRQTLEEKLKQMREGAEGLARELTSLRAELDKSRAAGADTIRTAEAAKTEQKLAFGKEHDRAETLARELAAAQKDADDRSARLAAAHTEVLQATEVNAATVAEQKLALARERDRADAVTRELVSARNELEAANRQIAAFSAPKTVGSTAGRSTVVELPSPQAQPTAVAAASGVDPNVVNGTARSTPESSASRSPQDEQRLLARANALLRQADISAARPLLEHALEHGSARAAFMLAETYDARVLQSWQVRGIAGDPTKAREFYQRAEAGGIEDAKDRIETLK